MDRLRLLLLLLELIALKKTTEAFRMHRFCLTKCGFRSARRIGIVVARHESTFAAPSNWQQRTSECHPLLNSLNKDDQSESQDDVLQRLEQEIARHNFGKPLNVNSPKQVSMAIFGTIQSTSKEILMRAAQGRGVEYERQQILAKLVLKHRFLMSKSKQQQRQSCTLASAVAVTNDATSDAILQEEQVGMIEEVTLEEEDTLTLTTSITDAKSGVELSYGQSVDALFDSKGSKIHHFWRDSLLQITKPSARAMISQLNSQQCPMGYDPAASPGIKTPASNSEAGKKGSLLHYVRQQKEKYSDCIILTRVGEFYETYGTDAILLVEHCGLNAMAGKARAGCPVRNVQATLDCLTSNGFRVAVYEEAADTDSSSGIGASAGNKSRLKNRMLAQIVSSASPTYLYDLVLAGNADALVTSPASRPYVGVLESAAGYTLVEVSMEEQSVRISERLTAEAVACHLAAYPPADPLIYVPSTPMNGKSTTALPFLPSRSDSASDGPGSRIRLKVLPASLQEEPCASVSDVERARRTIVGALLQMMERDDNDENVVKINDFVLVASCSTNAASCGGTQTNPLYMETAKQLGLMNDKTIPPLVSYLLPESAPAATRRFLRRWLLTPPPPTVADCMSLLVTHLKDHGPALPPLSVPPIGKVLALLRAGQASAQVYGELLAAMDATVAVLDTVNFDKEHVIVPLMSLLEYESGIAADPDSLRARCIQAMSVIEDVISPIHHVGSIINDNDDDQISDFGDLIPRAFFERNEASWRGRVQSAAAEESYHNVFKTAETLAKAVAVDFWGMKGDSSIDDLLQKATRQRSPIVQDVFNNIFALKQIPSWVDDSAKANYFHPRDRNGKLLRNRYTITNVQSALSDYVAACEQACLQVTFVLTRLSQTLCESGHLPAIVQAAHANLILSTAANHAANANALGWNSAITFEPDSSVSKSHLQNVWPYWMNRKEAVSNSFDMNGLFLLTAPNMSGKSTLMRSTAAACLLSNCGLCAPLGAGSKIARFDNLFVRGASADVPTEGKSAFGAEMGDIAALLRSCGNKSLVFVDELGRGTSPKDGTCLAGAVLEAMAEVGMTGVFATHLHDVLSLPLKGRDQITLKRMDFKENVNGNGTSDYTWTYKMKDGFCTNSLALVTAAKFGLPESILQRAQLFGHSIQGGLSSDSCNNIKANELTNENNPCNGESITSMKKKKKNLEQAIQLAEEIAGQAQGSAIRIPPQWISPPSLEGCTCVYILEIGGSNEEETRYYVGETDSFRQRLSQHRAKGGEWQRLTAAALPLDGGKSQARMVESLVIRKLAKAGFRMKSISDGRSVRSNGMSNVTRWNCY